MTPQPRSQSELEKAKLPLSGAHLLSASWPTKAVVSGWETGFQASCGPFMNLQVTHIFLGLSFPTAT